MNKALNILHVYLNSLKLCFWDFVAYMNSRKLCALKATHFNVKKYNISLLDSYLQEIDLLHFCKAVNLIFVYFHVFFIFNIICVCSYIYLKFKSHYFQTNIFVMKRIKYIPWPLHSFIFFFPPLQSVFKVATKTFGMIIYFF